MNVEIHAKPYHPGNFALIGTRADVDAAIVALDLIADERLTDEDQPDADYIAHAYKPGARLHIPPHIAEILATTSPEEERS